MLSLLHMGGVESKKIIDLIKKGDSAALEKIYNDNREAFINFSKKYNIEKYDAVDIYQDAIIALQENIITGKIDHLNSSISTYLFAIGKYKIFHSQRKNSRIADHNGIEFDRGIEFDEKSFDFDVDFSHEKLTNEQRILKKCFDQLGDRCKSVLRLFYYQGYTLDEITDILNYSDKKVLKSQKSRCLKQLKDLAKKSYE